MSGSLLRAYQLRAVARVEDAWNRGRRAPLLCAPTGSGKTVMAVELIHRARERGWRVLFLAPRRELIDQAVCKLDAFDVNVVMSGDTRRKDFAGITIASVDTLHARKQRSGEYPVLRPDLIVIDECHLFVTGLRAGIVNEWPDARVVGMTATPARKDGRALGMLFDDLIEVATVGELTSQGYLVPGRYFSISDPDLSKVRTTAGEYNAKDLAAAMDKPQLVGDIVATWLARAGGRRTVVFASSIGHSVALTDSFRAHGVSAEHVDANTPTNSRREIFARFRQGRTQVLTNCTLASYGFDLPELDCVVLARPTKSLVLYLQMIGRALRPTLGKSHCLVLDHAGVVRRFGFADEDREWRLDGRVTNWREDSGRAGRDLPPDPKLRDCPACKALFTGRECPECGWHAKPRGMQVETMDGDLVEIDAVRESDRERLKFFLHLRGEFKRRGKKPGAAAYSYRERYDEWPPREWNAFPAMVPGPDVRGWVKSRLIAFAKGREERAS